MTAPKSLLERFLLAGKVIDDLKDRVAALELQVRALEAEANLKAVEHRRESAALLLAIESEYEHPQAERIYRKAQEIARRMKAGHEPIDVN